MRSVLSIRFRWFFKTRCKYIRRDVACLTLGQLYLILRDPKYTIHLTVYENVDGTYSRRRFGGVKNFEEFRRRWEGFDLVDEGLNSEDCSIRGATYLDSYMLKPLYNECSRHRKFPRCRARGGLLRGHSV